MNQLYIILLFFLTLNLSAQDERKVFYGVVSNDSLLLSNVHVVNKTTNIGTISNYNGEFKIMAKENDILQFSNIQYKIVKLQISKQHFTKKVLQINLAEKTNELQEVVLENMAKGLGLPNAGKIPLDKLERNLNHYSQASVPVVILATLLGQQGGIDDIYNIISGNRKKDRTLKKLLEKDKELEKNHENVQIIRDHFKDEFFTNTITISKEQIDGLIHYCLKENIVFLFDRERYMEIIDVFIKNKKMYLNSLKN